jgi:hypothetical protein
MTGMPQIRTLAFFENTWLSAYFSQTAKTKMATKFPVFTIPSHKRVMNIWYWPNDG